MMRDKFKEEGVECVYKFHYNKILKYSLHKQSFVFILKLV
jgi:hypothetical protein